MLLKSFRLASKLDDPRVSKHDMLSLCVPELVGLHFQNLAGPLPLLSS